MMKISAIISFASLFSVVAIADPPRTRRRAERGSLTSPLSLRRSSITSRRAAC